MRTGQAIKLSGRGGLHWAANLAQHNELLEGSGVTSNHIYAHKPPTREGDEQRNVPMTEILKYSWVYTEVERYCG